MALPVLPAKYYLTHFFEFIGFLEKYNFTLLGTRETQFIAKFRAVSEDAQCTFVRMANRKSSLFDRSTFQKYIEIENSETAFEELIAEGFAFAVAEKEVAQLLSFLTKAKLRKWLLANGISTSQGLSRDELILAARENLKTLEIKKLKGFEKIIVQGFEQELQYLLFLSFGQIQKSLTLYTLRDLGIRETHQFRREFKPRFSNSLDALNEYFFAKSLDENIELPEELRKLLNRSLGFVQLESGAQALKDQLLFEIAAKLSGIDDESAILALSKSLHPSAREKWARALYSLDRKDECRAVLESIIEAPRNLEELLFAEDFESRKFNKKRVGYLTEILNNARELTLSDFYLKKPEHGVQEFYRAQGHKAQFSENYLWVSLFGVLFWDELFESEKSAIHSSFERSPSDLLGPDFYLRHETEIEAKLSRLREIEWFQSRLLTTVTEKYGQLNDIFQWHPSLAENLLQFILHSQKQDLALILRTMARQFKDYHSGFPDLMVEKNGVISFIEVKAEGDALRMNQMAKLRLLKDAGFEVEVLKVRWQADPNQLYVVIDVETTGGQSGFHRVTEIGAVKIQNGRIVDEFQTLINPGRSIPPFITQLTGITNQMVSEAPRFSDIAADFFKFLDGAIFVAHNVKFDYSFIQREFARCEIEFVRPQLCTSAGMRKSHPGLSSYSLKSLTEHFEISLDTHHRAMCDARAAAKLLLIMNEKRS